MTDTIYVKGSDNCILISRITQEESINLNSMGIPLDFQYQELPNSDVCCFFPPHKTGNYIYIRCVQEVMSDYFCKIEKQVQKLKKIYIGRWKYILFFNVVAFTVPALVVPCDEVLDSIMVELFPQILHNSANCDNQLVTCREPFAT